MARSNFHQLWDAAILSRAILKEKRCFFPFITENYHQKLLIRLEILQNSMDDNKTFTKQILLLYNICVGSV